MTPSSEQLGFVRFANEATEQRYRALVFRRQQTSALVLLSAVILVTLTYHGRKTGVKTPRTEQVCATARRLHPRPAHACELPTRCVALKGAGQTAWNFPQSSRGMPSASTDMQGAKCASKTTSECMYEWRA